MHQDTYGWRKRRSDGLLRPPTLIGYTSGGQPLAVTEVCYESSTCFVASPAAPERTYLIVLALCGMRPHGLWLAGRLRLARSIRSGWSCFYDLALQPAFRIADPIHSLLFYLPYDAIVEAGHELGGPAVAGLCHGRGECVGDPVIQRIGYSLLPALCAPLGARQLFVDHVLMALLCHVSRAYGVARKPISLGYMGLAPWQERRTKEFMSSRLADEIPLAELADSVGLPAGTFARAFKRSTGQAPFQWMWERRLERAVWLMSDGRLSLYDIARRVGFTDATQLERVLLDRYGALPLVRRKPA